MPGLWNSSFIGEFVFESDRGATKRLPQKPNEVGKRTKARIFHKETQLGDTAECLGSVRQRPAEALGHFYTHAKLPKHDQNVLFIAKEG